MAKTRTYTWISDPGHAWLSVPAADIQALELEDKISSCSYQRGSRVYLEEDGDAGVFIEAAKAKGWQLAFREGKPSNSQSPVRSYGNFDPGFLDEPKAGDKVYQQKDGRFVAYTVIGGESKKVAVEKEDGSRYGVPKGHFPRYFISGQKVEQIKKKKREYELLESFVKQAGLERLDPYKREFESRPALCFSSGLLYSRGQRGFMFRPDQGDAFEVDVHNPGLIVNRHVLEELEQNRELSPGEKERIKKVVSRVSARMESLAEAISFAELK